MMKVDESTGDNWHVGFTLWSIVSMFSTEPQEQGMSNSMKRTIFKTEIASKLKAVLRQHEK